MPDQTQELLAVLAKLHERYPHWRFGQLVCNVASWTGEERPGEAWDASDADLLRAASEHLARADDQATRGNGRVDEEWIGLRGHFGASVP